jgi:hypothetical protein
MDDYEILKRDDGGYAIAERTEENIGTDYCPQLIDVYVHFLDVPGNIERAIQVRDDLRAGALARRRELQRQEDERDY